MAGEETLKRMKDGAFISEVPEGGELRIEYDEKLVASRKGSGEMEK